MERFSLRLDDLQTQLIYLPDATLSVPTIPDHPTASDIEKAKATVADISDDFPFVDRASRANAWGALVTSRTIKTVDRDTSTRMVLAAEGKMRRNG